MVNVGLMVSMVLENLFCIYVQKSSRSNEPGPLNQSLDDPFGDERAIPRQQLHSHIQQNACRFHI